jgi:CubicO group peptidase (beta-lactamase class C family)
MEPLSVPKLGWLCGPLFWLMGCLADDPAKLGYADGPRDLGDGWEISTPEAEGLDPEGVRAAYRRFYSETQYVTAVSLLVVKHGRLVAEGYCRDRADRDTLSAIQSATKSVTSLVFGIALDRGHLGGVDTPLYDIVPEKFPPDRSKRAIRFDDLLTMRSGIGFSNDDFTMDMAYGDHADGLAYILAHPLVFEPGTRFNYQDSDPHLVSGALQKATGHKLADLADQWLLGPIGIRDFIWLEHQDGTTYGPFGLYLKPRDLARIGQLLANDGQWHDRQLVSAEWLAESTRAHAPVDPDPGNAGYQYGYYWWVAPDGSAFTACGHGGQYVFVRPSEALVVVLTAEPDTNNDEVAIPIAGLLELVRLISGS